jgi:hypothetical protein
MAGLRGVFSKHINLANQLLTRQADS